MSTATAGSDRVEVIDPGQASRRWPRYALAAILVIGAVMYASALWSGTWGNTYYTAAIRSMSSSFTNFVFGSFDPAGVVTVDKPPLSLWPQVISVWIFGYHDWAVLLPQVIEGVAAIFLLHRAVRMWAGENAALVAALVFALTPITVVTNRTNKPETMLVLTLVAAAYALARSVRAEGPKSRTKWLWFAAFLIGCGFLAKMLAAWIVVPAFVAAYLVGSRATWRRKLFDVAGAAVVLLVGSLWWVAVVDLWPGRKPYVGSSSDGTALDLVLGYNGIGRVFRGEVGGMQDASGNTAFGGETGPGRMFGQVVGGQISWLLPLALIALVVAAVLGVRRFARADTAWRAGWVLWGGWLVVNALVFSFQKGIFHSYYTTVMAPAIGALVGAAAVWAVRVSRESAKAGWLVLPAGVAITAVWAWVLISRNTAWNGWLRWAVVGVAAIAIGLLVLRGLNRAAVVISLVAVLLAPAVWSGIGAFAGPGNPWIPAAGPPAKMMLPAWAMGGGRGAGILSGDQRRILDYAKSRSDGAEIVMAVDGGAEGVTPYIIGTDETVVGIGGFSGTDPAPSVDQLAAWVRAGKLKFILTDSEASGDDPMPGERADWIRRNCAPVLTAGAQRLGECTAG
ncbi:glycosyltransferase family 39 protein [Kibdelosporangium phytohabitans]|uniref:Uncharacterized protein n=1 Tax=Kibdelosporangium phytohabitans TaxID=860235 RepID=A0A0N9HSJ2_9PSEU|nr:glycosyltransferase family 39 protein [Kibdelosporangium phytohabitans]ALG07955.1 hypothetical protein AOZ06_14425 [Kibdelosporangium phytohabitans]MBE1471102.1 4-amino-4-deoxy-L-arabinose transferase-like glycosyltransferase [Kibdelosporangium phytohabitans]